MSGSIFRFPMPLPLAIKAYHSLHRLLFSLYIAHNAVSVFTFNHVPTMLAVFRFHL